MPLASWPNTLPTKPLLADYALQQSHLPPLKSDMQGGNVRLRQQFTTRLSSLRISFPMTTAQFGTFKTFVYTTLGHGSAKFEMPILTGSGLETKTCFFSDGTFTARPTGAGWQVTFNLSVENF